MDCVESCSYCASARRLRKGGGDAATGCGSRLLGISLAASHSKLIFEPFDVSSDTTRDATYQHRVCLRDVSMPLAHVLAGGPDLHHFFRRDCHDSRKSLIVHS